MRPRAYFFVGEEFGRAIREAPRSAGRGADTPFLEGVQRSEVGLWVLRGKAREGQCFQANLDLLPLQFVAGNLKGYLKG